MLIVPFLSLSNISEVVKYFNDYNVAYILEFFNLYPHLDTLKIVYQVFEDRILVLIYLSYLGVKLKFEVMLNGNDKISQINQFLKQVSKL